MDFLNKLFSLFDRADSAMRQADRMERTVDRIEQKTEGISGGNSGTWKKAIYVLIIVAVILYVFLR
jgi:hypothetical protein